MNALAVLIVALVVIMMMAGCAPEPTGYMSAVVEYEDASRPSKDGDDK